MSGANISWESFDVHFLPKNFSYEENYHRKFYYPKIVYERIKQRLATRKASGSTGSLSGLSSCSSLPDLPEALLSENSKCPTLNRVDSVESVSSLPRREPCHKRVPFSLGESRDDDDSTASRASEGEDCSSVSGDSVSAAMRVHSVSTMDEQELWELICPLPRRRSSSLRRSKSPNNDSGHPKKVVRFADVMGLDLRTVRRFGNKDRPPRLPNSVMRDLRGGLEEAHKSEGTRYVCACFTPPGNAPDFKELVMTNGVSLESCFIGEQDRTITGIVRVANLCFRKLVIIRYTVNHWVTFDDITASYVLDSNDGATDKFSFNINLPKCFAVGARLEFAIRFEALDIGVTFWDNNKDNNYCLECFARSVPTRDSDFAWLHFL